MKSIQIKTNKINEMFQQLHDHIGGSHSVDIKEHILDVDNELGSGRIRGISFNEGITYLEFDMTFSEKMVLSIEASDKMPIYFTYCSKGKLAHSLGLDGEKRILGNFQTGILTNKSAEEHTLYFQADVRLQTSLITVYVAGNSGNEANNDLRSKLQQTFFNYADSENFVYIGSHNLKIAELTQQMGSITQKGIVRQLLLEGYVHMMLAMEIQQHSDDLAKTENFTGSLTPREMDSVVEVSEFIKNYPETQLCIKQLSHKSGLSPSKLQEGFKLMHDRTVSDYIRDVRVRKSEDLIKNTDLNISEVVYSIGLTSRSYFSKIFKKKYHCSPKQYKNQQQRLAVSA